MIIMDVKGVNWVGCAYEKFEAMCLEVEENMYKDTVKFVEDQVQTFGESVKRFYSDVMHDLLCDPPLDRDNLSAFSFPTENYSDVNDSKKSKFGKKKEHVKVGVKEFKAKSEVNSTKVKDVGHTGLIHRQRVFSSCTKSSRNCAKFSELYSRQAHGMRSYNKNMSVKETPIKDRLPGKNTSVGEDFSSVSLLCGDFSNENCDTSCDQPKEVVIPSKPLEGISCDSMRESCAVTNATQCTNDVSINDTLDMSDGKRWNKLLESSTGGLSAGLKGEFINSNEDAMESSTGVHGIEIIQQSDSAKLEETCVMVSGEELHFVSPTLPNYKSYKKKVSKPFTSRTNSARKQEYEQLALWHGHHTRSVLEGKESNKSVSNDFCESEWEIL